MSTNTRTKQFLLTLTLLFCVPFSQAGNNIVLLLSSNALSYREVEKGIRVALNEKNSGISITSLTLDLLLQGEPSLPQDEMCLKSTCLRIFF